MNKFNIEYNKETGIIESIEKIFSDTMEKNDSDKNILIVENIDVFDMYNTLDINETIVVVDGKLEIVEFTNQIVEDNMNEL